MPNILNLDRPYHRVDQNYAMQDGVVFGWDDHELAFVEAWWLKERPPGWQADRIMREIGTHHEG